MLNINISFSFPMCNWFLSNALTVVLQNNVTAESSTLSTQHRLTVWRWRSGLLKNCRANCWIKGTRIKSPDLFTAQSTQCGGRRWDCSCCWHWSWSWAMLISSGPLDGPQVAEEQAHTSALCVCAVSGTTTRGQEWLCSSSVVSFKMHFIQSVASKSFYWRLQLSVYGVEEFMFVGKW